MYETNGLEADVTMMNLKKQNTLVYIKTIRHNECIILIMANGKHQNNF